MDKAKLNAAMQIVRTMTLEEQRALNSLLCANIRAGHKVAAAENSMSFGLGDVIQFDGKTRGPIFLEITGFSRDRTKIKGKQLNKGWKTAAGTPWTVGATLAKAATREQALKA
jgi:hypothetical protein